MSARRTVREQDIAVIMAILALVSLATLLSAFASNHKGQPEQQGFIMPNCSGLSVPFDSVSTTTLDTTGQSLAIEYKDSLLGYRTVVIPYLHSTCQTNLSVKGIIDHVLAEHAEVEIEMCADMAAAAQSGETSLRGQTVYPAAAELYVTEYC